MKNYSIIRIGNEYVVRPTTESVLKIASRRKAARLVTDAAELLESHPPQPAGRTINRLRSQVIPDPGLTAPIPRSRLIPQDHLLLHAHATSASFEEKFRTSTDPCSIDVDLFCGPRRQPNRQCGSRVRGELAWRRRQFPARQPVYLADLVFGCFLERISSPSLRSQRRS